MRYIILSFFIFLFKKSKTTKSKKDFFFYGWLFGFGYFLSSLYWISISLTFDQNFKFLKQNLFYHGYQMVDGILADLGVSSYQFDKPERKTNARCSYRIFVGGDCKRECASVSRHCSCRE